MARQGFIYINSDPYIYQEITEGTSAATGIDSVDNNFKISVSPSTGVTPSTFTQMTIDPTSGGNITFTPNLGSVSVVGGFLVSGTSFLSNVRLDNAVSIGTSTVATNTYTLTAYNTNTLSQQTFVTFTAGNPPTADLSSGVTIGGAYIYRVGGNKVAIADGGTNANSYNNDGVLYFDGTKFNSTTVGTSGQILTSNGVGLAPSFQAAGASGITTLDGDTGSATGSTVTLAGTANEITTAASGATVTFSVPSVFIGPGSVAATTTFKLPTTTSTVGQLLINSIPVFQAYGTRNLFVGADAGNFTFNTSNVTDNVVLGYEAMLNIAGGAAASSSRNVVIGSNAGQGLIGNTTDYAQSNVIIGYDAAAVNDGAQLSYNVYIGDSAGYQSVAYNVGIGYQAAYQVNSNNVAIGYQALRGNSNFSLSNNVAIGFNACWQAGTNTQDNVIIGYYACAAITGRPYQSVVIGRESVGQSTGNLDNSVMIGYRSGWNYTGGEANNILIGWENEGVASETNVLRIGNGTGTGSGNLNTAYISGIYGIANGSTAGVVIVDSNNQLSGISGASGTVLFGGTKPAWGTLVAGTGVSIVTAPTTITISASASGFTWTDVTSGSENLAAENGYVVDKTTLTTMTLPSNNSLGDTIKIIGKGTGGWTIVYGLGQYIIINGVATTTTTGSLSSSGTNDCVELVCTIPSAIAPIFTVVSSMGNLILV